MSARAPGGSRGQAMVEFALAASLMLLILFGGLVAGSLVDAHMVAAGAVRQGARVAAQLGDGTSTHENQDQVDRRVIDVVLPTAANMPFSKVEEIDIYQPAKDSDGSLDKSAPYDEWRFSPAQPPSAANALKGHQGFPLPQRDGRPPHAGAIGVRMCWRYNPPAASHTIDVHHCEYAVMGIGGLSAGMIIGQYGGRYQVYTLTGELVQTVETGKAYPGYRSPGGVSLGQSLIEGACIDHERNLYVTAWQADAVLKYDLQGRPVTPAPWFSAQYANAKPESCVLDKKGQVWVGEAPQGFRTEKSPPSLPRILGFNTDGSQVQAFTASDTFKGSHGEGADWLDLKRDGCHMLYTTELRGVLSFDICAGQQGPDIATVPPAGAAKCFQQRILAQGDDLVQCEDAVYRFDDSGNKVRQYDGSTTPGLPTGHLRGLDVDPDGAHFWVGVRDTGEVFRVGLDDSAVDRRFKLKSIEQTSNHQAGCLFEEHPLQCDVESITVVPPPPGG
ncbi:MAG: TadE/TadG family type IV pilus assembly protein [Candidatus Dormibacteria bacterium]